jgi:hypothetical protein
MAAGLFIPLVCMIIEDFRQRAISIIHILLLFVFSFGYSFYAYSWHIVLENCMLNFLLLLYLFSCVTIYLFIRKKNPKALFEDYFGMGDALYLCALTPMMGLKPYLLFLLLSMITSLIWWFFKLKTEKTHTTIPFVGISGFVFCGYLIIKLCQ